MSKPVHSLVVEHLSLAETLRLAAIKTCEQDLTAVYHDVKKMYTPTKDVPYGVYIDALNVLKETNSIGSFLLNLSGITDDAITESIDEVLTVRINRLINLYSGIDVKLESFIGDYHDLIVFIDSAPGTTKESLECALDIFKESLLLAQKSSADNESEYTSIINWESVATNTECAIHENYSCVLMPVPKAAIYIGSLNSYSQCIDILSNLTFPKIVTPVSHPETFEMLEMYRNTNEVFKINKWTSLVLDKTCLEYRYWEVYYSADGSYHFTLPYQN